MLEVSQRGLELNQSPIRGLVPFARAAAAKGRKVLHLNIGQPDLPTPPEALEKVREDQATVISYGPSEGLPVLRESLRGYYDKYDAGLAMEDVLVTTGASEAILFALYACCNEGDEVIVPEPFYANYIGFAQMCGVRIVPISTSFQDQFDLPSAEAFEEAITSRTKAILLCNPSNPTGRLYGKDQLAQLAALVQRHDLFLVVDEVYREFCYDRPFTSILSFQEANQHVVVIDSISKLFSSCGARVGFMITKNEAVRAAAIKYAQLRLCPPYHGQLLATACYEVADSYIPEAIAEYRNRRDFLFERLSSV